MRKKQYLLLAIIFVIVVAVASLFALRSGSSTSSKVLKTSSNQVTTHIGTVSYKGETGKDALTLLKHHATVVQDKSGLVTTINGRKADKAKHEFWEFLVNGKEAQVGPAQYQTKSTDTIEWKIGHY
jgi:hypothetical protein